MQLTEFIKGPVKHVDEMSVGFQSPERGELFDILHLGLFSDARLLSIAISRPLLIVVILQEFQE